MSKGTEQSMLWVVPSSGSLGPSPLPNAPRLVATQTMVQQPQTQDHVFAMTQQEAQTSNAIVKVTITLSGHIARTMFDPEVTHSFISNSFSNKLNRYPELL